MTTTRPGHTPEPEWKRKPDQPGWWWLKESGSDPYITFVGYPEGCINAEWYGPLQPPACFTQYPDEESEG